MNFHSYILTMDNSYQKLRYIIDTLRIGYAVKNPKGTQEEKINEVSAVLGKKGWKPTNIHYFKQVILYDMEQDNGFEHSLAILNGETTTGNVLKLVNSGGEYETLDELESYLYITALCNLLLKKPLDNLRKIGRGDDYKSRMRTLSSSINKKYLLNGTKSPYGFMPVKLWKGKREVIVELEKRLHNEFFHLNFDGEFFDMDYEFFEKIEKIVSEYDVCEIKTLEEVEEYDVLKKDFSVDNIIDIVRNNGKF